MPQTRMLKAELELEPTKDLGTWSVGGKSTAWLLPTVSIESMQPGILSDYRWDPSNELLATENVTVVATLSEPLPWMDALECLAFPMGSAQGPSVRFPARRAGFQLACMAPFISWLELADASAERVISIVAVPAESTLQEVQGSSFAVDDDAYIAMLETQHALHHVQGLVRVQEMPWLHLTSGLYENGLENSLEFSSQSTSGIPSLDGSDLGSCCIQCGTPAERVGTAMWENRTSWICREMAPRTGMLEPGIRFGVTLEGAMPNAATHSISVDLAPFPGMQRSVPGETLSPSLPLPMDEINALAPNGEEIVAFKPVIRGAMASQQSLCVGDSNLLQGTNSPLQFSAAVRRDLKLPVYTIASSTGAFRPTRLELIVSYPLSELSDRWTGSIQALNAGQLLWSSPMELPAGRNPDEIGSAF